MQPTSSHASHTSFGITTVQIHHPGREIQSQARSSQYHKQGPILAGVNKDLGQRNPADGGSQNLWDRLARTMQVQPVLLNKQDDTSFALASTASKAFSRRVQINTVGGKGSVRIKVPCNISSHATQLPC